MTSREHHLTRSDLAQLRGPYLRRPGGLDGYEWERWACEVLEAAPLARRIADAADGKRKAQEGAGGDGDGG